MKNKKNILCIVLAMLLVSLGIVFLCRKNVSDATDIDQSAVGNIIDSIDDAINGDDVQNADENEDEDSDDSTDKNEDSKDEDNNGTKPGKNNGKDGKKPGKDNKEDEKLDPVPPQSIEKFPYTIPNTQLEILTVANYNGVYLEDGSSSNVSGVAAVIVKNTGDKPIEYASISLNDNGKELVFNGSDIPAGQMIVIQEKNKAKFNKGELTDCSADVAYTDSLSKTSKDVKVTENKNNTISVKNTSGSTIPCVRVFYKYYYDEEDAYVGGITYVAKVTDLGAGSETTVSPSNYASGYSKVVMVRTYDSAS